MNKTIVIYSSKYGYTETYAKWISEKLNADIYPNNKVNINMLSDYSTIIYGGGIYAGGILGISLITKNLEKLKDKKLIIFTVGLADPNNKSQFEPLLNNLPKELTEKHKIFHLRGGIDYKDLSFVHKIMMGMLKKKIDRIPEDKRDTETKMMIETYGKAVDFRDETSILPLINFCTSVY